MRKKYKTHDYLINNHGSVVGAENDKNHVDERRYANLLILTANGTLLMSIWSLLLFLMNILGKWEDEFMADFMTKIISAVGTVFVFAVTFAIAVLFRYIVWRGGRKEAENGQKRNGYLAVAILLTVYDAYAIVSFAYLVINKTVDGYAFLSFIFDATSFLILCQLLFSAFKIRKVRNMIANAESGEKISSGADIQEVL